MTHLEALRVLLEEVEAGDSRNDGTAFKALGENWLHFFDGQQGSLDAVKALHEAVLSGWTIRLTATIGDDRSFPYVHVFKQRMTQEDVPIGANSSGYKGFCLARAWLIAILRALIAIEEKKV